MENFEKINRFYIGFLKLMSTNLESMHIVKTPIYVLVISSGKVQSLLTYKFEFSRFDVFSVELISFLKRNKLHYRTAERDRLGSPIAQLYHTGKL